MKTIPELQRKWWYRLLKVFSLFVAFVSLICVITITWNTYGPEFDPVGSHIVCQDGRNFPVDKIGMYSEFGVYNFDETFRTWCSTELFNDNGLMKLKKINDSISSEQNYTLIVKYTSRSWLEFIGYSVLWILGILLVFEILRRVFYYIILGSVFPPTSESTAQKPSPFRSLSVRKVILGIEAGLIFLVIGVALSWLFKYLVVALVVFLNISDVEIMKDIDNVFSIGAFVIAYLIATKRYRRRSLVGV